MKLRNKHSQHILLFEGVSGKRGQVTFYKVNMQWALNRNFGHYGITVVLVKNLFDIAKILLFTQRQYDSHG